ncbi:MAG: hypothetical protein ORN29_08725 [Rhodoferax sp.]|nr:hypothetical protein [Rhodoferax sp.]
MPDINGNPALLPLSVAMKKNKKAYLSTLEAFSLPVRQLWRVVHIGEGDFVFDFQSSPLVYAHWSGQKAAEFVTACAAEALQQTLMDEALYLQAYDQAFAHIDQAYELPNKTTNLPFLGSIDSAKWLPNASTPQKRPGTGLAPTGTDCRDRNEIESMVAQAFMK